MQVAYTLNKASIALSGSEKTYSLLITLPSGCSKKSEHELNDSEPTIKKAVITLYFDLFIPIFKLYIIKTEY